MSNENKKDNILELLNQHNVHQKILDSIHDTYIEKNKAYGNSFSELYAKLGIISAATQITHKYNRFINLVTNPAQSQNDESIRDTLIDMANYCIMTVMELDVNNGDNTEDTHNINN